MPNPYEDDLTVADEEDLWRRIPRWWIIENRDTGGWRVSSAAFEDHPNGSPMSVFLSTVIRVGGRSPESVTS
jgi:hypothetical protein